MFKSVVPRERAQKDIEAATDHYLSEASERIALGFVDDVAATFQAIIRNPSIGSTRYAHELKISGLRSRLMDRYPYLVIYIETDTIIDVWRILHVSRDIPRRLSDDD